jgi:hypothetical protein
MSHDASVPKRRALLGWLPLVALVVATGGAMTLGLIQSQPVPSATQVLDATATGQTVGYTSAEVTTSTNPDLRSRSTAAGTVDFGTGDGIVTRTEHSIGYSSSNNSPPVRTIDVNTTQQRAVDGRIYMTVRAGVWVQLPRSAHPGRGLVASLSAYLGVLDAPPQDLRLVGEGTSTIDGMATTAYRVVVSAPVQRCQTGVAVGANRQPVATEIWIDREWRLRQVRTEMTYKVGPPPARFAHLVHVPLPTGMATAITVLRITAYGSPVHVAVPAVVLRQGVASSFGVAVC